MKTTLIILTLFISGCGTNLSFKDRIRGANDLARAVAQFPVCRAEWESYAPDSLRETVADDYILLDTTFDRFISLVEARPSITLIEGLNQIIELDNDVTKLEQAFSHLSNHTLGYAISTGERNIFLAECDSDVRAGWNALTQNSPLLDWLKVYSPYAKSAVRLIPLLL